MKNLNNPSLTLPLSLMEGNKNKKAFTLVELIIVITILAILATIAFVSFQNYTKDARDANRLSTLNNIEKGLNLYYIKTGKYPTPDSPVTISLSGSVISYQGYIGENVSKIINMNKTPLDPKDNLEYYYAIGNGGKGYKLLSYGEGEIAYKNIFPQTYAVDYSIRYPKVIGKGPAMLTDTNNNIILTNIDLFLTESGTTYKAIIDGTTSITGSGKDIGGGLQMLALKGGDFSPPKSCPEGFIPVPGNQEFSQPGFCVAKYEMALERDLTTDELSSANNRNTWSGSTNSRSTNTTWTDGKIVSASGKYPIANITQPQAIAACTSIGGHLITNNEWMTIARDIEANAKNWSTQLVGSGYISNGVSNDAILGCGGTNTKTQYPELTYDRGAKTGPGSNENCNTKRQLKLSNGEIIWDLAGNVQEHVNKANTLDGTNYNSNSFSVGNACSGDNRYSWNNNESITPVATGGTCIYTNGYTQAKYGPAGATYSSDEGMGRIYSYNIANNLFIRGGGMNGVTDSGVFSLSLSFFASGYGSQFGFRCSF